MKTLLIVEHYPGRADGILRHLLEEDNSGLDCRVWKCSEDVRPPSINFDGLILSGGPMMVEHLNQGRHPFYVAERALIKAAEENDVPVLGICLGAQILADLSGGAVAEQNWVIGWNSVTITEAGHSDELFSGIPHLAAFELHRDAIVNLPPSAIQLATSSKSANEAFRLSQARIWGCLFHPEFDVDHVQRIYDADPNRFLARNVQRTDLVPVDDGRGSRHRLLRNFVDVVRGT